MNTLENKTILITGSSRGIGAEMARRFAKEKANVVITGKTTEKHDTLPGTIFSVAEEVEKAGGKALPLMLDVRDENQIEKAVASIVKTFGGIDILINNASAISLTNTLNTSLKRFDLMMGVNARATFACSRACIPHLMKSENPHILNMSPPLHMLAKWFKDHMAYTYSKYGMSVCTLGMSAEFKEAGIAVNSLWPKTTIATSAIKVNFPPELYAASRDPSIVANAAYYVVTQNSRELTGQFLIDEEVLTKAGETDFARYNMMPGVTPMRDLFLE
ncbi:MAG: short chain dehydrogenase [Gammaproteobacteria bacterium RIFCSPHIGHO2_12_FULL_40_19]|nr:MAG: short chain dehydrogenase [Gammaproteobacteria bacterium RIFCSPHIGHO2_12_FULL_40_19]